MAGTDFTRLTEDEKINGIKAAKLPDYFRTKYHGGDVRETFAQLSELTIQLGINMGLSPDEALSWGRKLQESIPRSEFDSWVATLVDGGPSIFMNTLSELQTAYPNGAAGVALVRETDPAKIYVWNGTAWEDFGDYQGIEIKDGSVTTKKINDGAVDFSKQTVLKNIESANLFTGDYTNLWVRPTGDIYRESGLSSGLIPLKFDKTYKVEVSDNANRFTLALCNQYDNNGAGKVIGERKLSAVGKNSYVFRNTEGYKYLIVGVGNGVTGLTVDDLTVTEIDSNSSIEKSYTIDDVSPYATDIWYDYKTQKFLSGSTGNYALVVPIPKKSTINIETLGKHNRFHVYLSTKSIKSGEPTDGALEIININDASAGYEKLEVYNNDKRFIILLLSRFDYRPVPISIKVTYETYVEELLETYKDKPAYNDIVNLFQNGGLTMSSDHYVITGTNYTASNSGIILEKTDTEWSFTINSDTKRIANKMYYYSVLLEGYDYNDVAFGVNGTVNDDMSKITKTSEGTRISYMYSSTSTVDINLLLRGSSLSSKLKIKGFIVADVSYLNRSEGYSIRDIDKLVSGFNNGVLNLGSSKIDMRDMTNYLLKLSDTQKDPITSNTVDTHPVLFGVKYDNSKNNEAPRPVGWLYYSPIPPYKMYYAKGDPGNLEYLCDWKREVTWDTRKNPSWYRPVITKRGDIVFVYRGDRHGLGSDSPDSRQNPIVYPAGNYDNPIVVDLGQGIKPTAWLQNAGVEYVSNENTLLFGEYTRPHHKTANIWKVVEPVHDPNNWRVVKSFTLSGSNQTGIKHIHQMDYDPWSKKLYSSTGDDDSAAAIYSSDDNGENWTVEFSGQRQYARVINFVFTKDGAYWANDDSKHGFYKVERNSDGTLDFTNIITLYEFNNVPPTYINCLIDTFDVHGVLILNRFDGDTESELPVHFYDLKLNKMHVIANLSKLQNSSSGDGGWGFRVEAASWYHMRGDDRILLGLFNPANRLDILGNTVDTTTGVNNLVLRVLPFNETFKLSMGSIQI